MQERYICSPSIEQEHSSQFDKHLHPSDVTFPRLYKGRLNYTQPGKFSTNRRNQGKREERRKIANVPFSSKPDARIMKMGFLRRSFVSYSVLVPAKQGSEKQLTSSASIGSQYSALTKVPNQPLLTSAQREKIQKYNTFIELANQWRSETKYMSVMNDIISHTAYQKIIAMGKDVVPMILDELRKEPAHWFWALKSITRHNPIKPEDRGRIKKMTEAWLDWGRQNGYGY